MDGSIGIAWLGDGFPRRVIALGLAAAVLFSIPVAGCREQRSPDAQIWFSLDVEQKPLLTRVIREFAAAEALSIEDIGKEVPVAGPGTLFFVLRRAEEIRIYIANNNNKLTDYHIGIFDWSRSSDWEPLWGRLLARLHETWPDKFPDPNNPD